MPCGNYHNLYQLVWKSDFIIGSGSESEVCSVVSNSLQPHGLYSSWNSPGQKTGVGSLAHLQGIFPIQGLNLGLPHGRQILYQLSHQGNPRIPEWVAFPFSSGSSWFRNWTGVSYIAARFFINWATGEALLIGNHGLKSVCPELSHHTLLISYPATYQWGERPIPSHKFWVYNFLIFRECKKALTFLGTHPSKWVSNIEPPGLDLMSGTWPWMGDVRGIDCLVGRALEWELETETLRLDPGAMTQGTKFTCLDLGYLRESQEWFSDQASMEGF